MRQAQTYKPSNTFSFLGFILMFISMLISGALLSWLYVILQAVIPFVYLCILITIGFSAAIGAIGALFVKIYKIRHPGLAITATLIAMLFVYLFHWCIYVAKDCDKHIYTPMKEENAAEYFLGVSESEVYSVESSELAGGLMAYFKATKVNTLGFTSAERSYFNAKQQDMYDSGASIWEFYDYDKTFGTTLSEVAQSLTAMRGMNAYDFYINYRKQPEHTIGYLLVHPSDLWSDIKDINSVGRWTMRSSRSALLNNRSTTNNNINGIMLWITWFGEMLLMFIPAIAVISSKAKAPFIEQDNDWAVTDKTKYVFSFVDPYPGQSNGEKQFKAIFLNDIDSLFTLQPLTPQMGSLNTYYTVKYCHSKFYTENYITVTHTKVTNARNNQKASTDVVKNIKVDADYIATLHAMFGYPVPQGCQGVNKFAQQQAPQQQQAQQEYAQPTNQQPQPAYAQQTNQQPQPAYAQQTMNGQSQQAANNQPQQATNGQSQQPANDNTGEMEGIDTSNLDLSSLDNMSK